MRLGAESEDLLLFKLLIINSGCDTYLAKMRELVQARRRTGGTRERFTSALCCEENDGAWDCALPRCACYEGHHVAHSLYVSDQSYILVLIRVCQ